MRKNGSFAFLFLLLANLSFAASTGESKEKLEEDSSLNQWPQRAFLCNQHLDRILISAPVEKGKWQYPFFILTSALEAAKEGTLTYKISTDERIEGFRLSIYKEGRVGISFSLYDKRGNQLSESYLAVRSVAPRSFDYAILTTSRYARKNYHNSFRLIKMKDGFQIKLDQGDVVSYMMIDDASRWLVGPPVRAYIYFASEDYLKAHNLTPTIFNFNAVRIPESVEVEATTKTE